MESFTYGITDVPKPIQDEDILQVRKYIVGLENFIKKCPTPMSIALQGDWGTGKTTFLKTMEKDFEGTPETVKTIYFNTWQYSQFNLADNLYTSFLNNIVAQLVSKDSELAEKASNFMKGLWKVMAGVAKDAVMRAADTKAQEFIGVKLSDHLAEMGVTAQKEQALIVKNLKDKYAELIQDIVNELKKKNKGEDSPRIVIFVDDLDRLNPARAVEMLEALKLFMDVENCVYVLAIDYDVVVNGVRQKYGSSMTEDKCRSFFDKIIQLPFSMPVSSYHIDGLLRSIFQNAMGQYLPVAGHFVEQTLGMNPRTLKRLANSYYLLEAVEQEQMGGNGERSDLQHTLLLLILTVQMYNELAYDDLARCRTGEALIRKLGLTNPEEDEEDEENVQGEADTSVLRKKADMAMMQLSNVYKELQKLSKEKKLADIWVQEIHLSSITKVTTTESRNRDTEIYSVIVGEEQREFKKAADALGFIVAKLLNQRKDMLGEVLKEQEGWISLNGEKRTGDFRQPKAIDATYEGQQIYVGTSNNTLRKTNLLKELFRQLKVSSNEVKWFQGDKDLLA